MQNKKGWMFYIVSTRYLLVKIPRGSHWLIGLGKWLYIDLLVVYRQLLLCLVADRTHSSLEAKYPCHYKKTPNSFASAMMVWLRVYKISKNDLSCEFWLLKPFPSSLNCLTNVFRFVVLVKVLFDLF